jgi:hypothetical protein
MKSDWQTARDHRSLSVAGEAEAGSAGEQPAKEYPAETHQSDEQGRWQQRPFDASDG